MSEYSVVITMIIVGALIGGITNSIAIKMLFRPYNAIFIGKWRIPFTPGLIPKRRQELAEQLGKLVVNHLLTAEGLKNKLANTVFINEINNWVKQEAKQFLRSDKELATMLEKWLGLESVNEKFVSTIDLYISRKIEDIVSEIRPLTIKEVIPIPLQKRLDDCFPIISAIVVEKCKDYIQSDEGIEKLSNMVDRFLVGKGKIGNMISLFLGNDRLADKIQPEIIKMLNDKGTYELIEQLLRNEWLKQQNKKVSQIEQQLLSEDVKEIVKQKLMKQVPVQYLHQPLCNWAPRYETVIVEEILPKVIDNIGQAISDQLVQIMQKLKLEEIVKEQVEQFSVGRLEDIVLSISRKEFKLITYLGALLGGLIGLVQGIFIILFS